MIRASGTGRDNPHMVEVKVQEGVFYRMWLSQEAEEAMKRAIPDVDIRARWEADLQDIGAVQRFEEHGQLVNITFGHHNDM